MPRGVAARRAYNRRRVRRRHVAAVGVAWAGTEWRRVLAEEEPQSRRSGCRTLSSSDGRIRIRRTRRSTASKSKPTSTRSPRFQERAGTKGISTGGALQAHPTTSRRLTGWRHSSTTSAWSRSTFRNSICQRSGSRRRGKWWRKAPGNPSPSRRHFRSINRSEPGSVPLEPVWLGTGTGADFMAQDVKGKAVLLYGFPNPGGRNDTALSSGALRRADAAGAAAGVIALGFPRNIMNEPQAGGTNTSAPGPGVLI